MRRRRGMYYDHEMIEAMEAAVIAKMEKNKAREKMHGGKAC